MMVEIIAIFQQLPVSLLRNHSEVRKKPGSKAKKVQTGGEAYVPGAHILVEKGEEVKCNYQ